MKPVQTIPFRRIVPFPGLTGKTKPKAPSARDPMKAIGGTPPDESAIEALGMALSVNACVHKLPERVVRDIRDAFEIVHRVLSDPGKGAGHAG